MVRAGVANSAIGSLTIRDDGQHLGDAEARTVPLCGCQSPIAHSRRPRRERSVPFVAEAVKLTGGIHAGQRAGEVGRGISVADKQDLTRPADLGAEGVTRPDARPLHGVHRERHLVLGADPGSRVDDA